MTSGMILFDIFNRAIVNLELLVANGMHRLQRMGKYMSPDNLTFLQYVGLLQFVAISMESVFLRRGSSNLKKPISVDWYRYN